MPEYVDIDNFVKEYEYSEQEAVEYEDEFFDNLTEGDEQ